MRLDRRSAGEADIVEVDGRIDASNAAELEKELTGLAADGAGPVVLDFSRVDYISSAGLRVLLIGLRELAGAGRKLRLAALNPDVLDVVRLTGFDKLLACHDTVEDALATAAG